MLGTDGLGSTEAFYLGEAASLSCSLSGFSLFRIAKRFEGSGVSSAKRVPSVFIINALGDVGDFGDLSECSLLLSYTFSLLTSSLGSLIFDRG